MMQVLLLSALVSSAHAQAPTAAPPGVTVEAWVDTLGAKADAKGPATLHVAVRAPDGTAWTLDDPAAKGVTLGNREERVEDLGPDQLTTRSWPLVGSGSIILEGVCAKVDGRDPVCADPLYLDLGKPRERKEMADITEPGRLLPFPPLTIALGVLGVVMAGAFAVLGLRRMKRPAPPPPPIPEEPPYDAALRRWNAVRADDSLSDYAKALALSEIFRTYAEAVLAFPARALSTTETLAHLDTLPYLPKENLPRVRRILRATDKVKYAESRPSPEFFEELDSDLRAFIDATRPREPR